MRELSKTWAFLDGREKSVDEQVKKKSKTLQDWRMEAAAERLKSADSNKGAYGR